MSANYHPISSMNKNIEIVQWQSQEYSYEWLEGNNEESYQPYNLVHAVLFNDKGKVLIQYEYDNWRFNGGGPKPGESYQDTLVREMDEELSIRPKNISLLGAFRIKPLTGTSPQEYYQLCVFCQVDKINEQKIDPEDGSKDPYIFVEPSDVDKYVNWGEHGKQMLSAGVKHLLRTSKDL